MHITHTIFVVVFAIFNSVSCFSQATITAKIISKSVDNLIDVKAVALNNDAVFKDEYTYLLFSLKKGIEGNYSRNSQSGKFSLSPNEEKELSTLKISIQKEEECKIYLFIRKNDALISKDSAIIYADEKAKKIVSETEFEIKGIVTESVITKVGKDFYDYFYQMYITSGNQYPFIINIKEKPYFGRSSIITVEVEDEKILEFYSKPNQEYLKSAANATLQKLVVYAQQRKILYKTTRI